jgi:hypothetical protein
MPMPLRRIHTSPQSPHLSPRFCKQHSNRFPILFRHNLLVRAGVLILGAGTGITLAGNIIAVAGVIAIVAGCGVAAKYVLEEVLRWRIEQQIRQKNVSELVDLSRQLSN